MGSFAWDNPCYLQYYNGRPLSVALTEACNCDQSPYFENDFAVPYQHYRPRSQSTGRRFKRESYRIYHPNVEYATFRYSPPYHHRMIDRSASRDFFVEKFVTYEEEQCRPNYGCISYVRTPSPPVRQIKIRSRPSSCFDLSKKEEIVREERRDEHYNYNYNFTVPIKRESPAKVVHHVETNTREFTLPERVRPSMRDAATTTDGLPRKPIRPLSFSETQVLDRYEQEEKIRRESITERAGSCISYITAATQKPIESANSASYLTTTTTTATKKPIESSSSVSYSTTTASQRSSESTGFNYLTSSTAQRPLETTGFNYLTSSTVQRPLETTGFNYITSSTVQRPLETTGFNYITTSERPSYHSYDVDIDDDSDDKQPKRVSTKAQRKDFVQRMHIRNGTALKSFNTFNKYSEHGKNQVIVRPTAKPREALVDAPAIVAPPGESEPSTPTNFETEFRSRKYFQSS